MTSADDKIKAIEQSLSHQARLSEQLNQVIYEQGRQLDAFTQIIKRLEGRVKRLEQGTHSNAGESTADEASPWKDPEM